MNVVQVLGQSSLLSQAHYWEIGSEVEQRELERAYIYNTSVAGGGLTLRINAGPSISF